MPPQNVLLVNCRSPKLRYFPMYEAFLARELETHFGKKVKIVTLFDKQSPASLLEHIESDDDLIVFWEYFTTKAKSYLFKYFEVANYLKNTVKNPLLFGGFWPTTHGRFYKAFEVFDHLFEGYSIDRTVQAIGQFSPSTPRFVDVRGETDWDKYELDFKYFNNKHDYYFGEAFWGYLTSISCTRNCTFCWVNSARNDGSGYSERSVQKVMRDIDLIIENYPDVEKIMIKDLYFFAKEKRAFEILDYILEKGLKTEFNLDVTVYNLREDFLKKVAAMGLVTDLFFGLESFNDETRKRVGKPYTKEKLEEAFRLVDKYGINLTGNVILGLPWQDKSEITDAINQALYYSRKHKHVYISMNVLKPEYGTDLQLEYFDDLHERFTFDDLIDLYNNIASDVQDRLYGDKFSFIDLEKVHLCVRVINRAKRASMMASNRFKVRLFTKIRQLYENQLSEPFFNNKLVAYTLVKRRVDLIGRLLFIFARRIDGSFFKDALDEVADILHTRGLLRKPKHSGALETAQDY